MPRAVLLFLFGLAVTAAPIVAFPHLPTQDGGGHYNTAMVLAGLASDAKAFFGQYFETVPTPPSNQLASQIMAWVAGLGFGAQAERIAWTLIFAAASAVMVVNLWLLRREALVFALLLFPLFAGVLANLGFMNYLIGLLLFVQSAFWIQFGLRRPSLGWAGGLVALSVATYLAHPLAGLTLAAAAGSFAAGQVLRWRESPLLPLGCALACAVLAALVIHDAWPQVVRFFASTAHGLSGGAPGPAGVPDSLRERLIFVFGLGYFVSYSPADYLFSAGFALVVLWLAWRIFRPNSAWRPEDAWLASAATLLVLAMIVPRRFEYYLPERIFPCLLAVLVIWLAATPLDRPAYRTLLAAGLLLNSGLLLWRLHWGARIDSVLSEYASVAPALPLDASLLSIGTATAYLQQNCRAVRPRVLPCNFRPTLHFLGEIIGERNIALLTNYQLQPQTGFFPIRLRPPWSEYTSSIGRFERWPPLPEEGPDTVADAAQLIERQQPDVIVTWDDRLATGGPAALVPETLQPLLRHYTKVFTSRPLGAASVYRKRVP